MSSTSAGPRRRSPTRCSSSRLRRSTSRSLVLPSCACALRSSPRAAVGRIRLTGTARAGAPDKRLRMAIRGQTDDADEHAGGRRPRCSRGARTYCSGQATPHGEESPSGRWSCASRPPRTSLVSGCADASGARRIPWRRGDFNERLAQAARRRRRTGRSRSPSMRSATSSARSGTARAAVALAKWTSSGVRCPRP